ncbi:MAG: glycosyltransferase family 4 protein [Nitrososphaerota archaeon]|nr:glycosyltransferase family 4 protein [Nitrososphaerota archaeon]
MCPPRRAKIKILFVYYKLASFVRSDLEILRRHFDVKELEIPTFRNPFNILKLFLWTARVDLVYTWFAGTNAFFAVLFSKLLRKKSLVVIGGYDVAYVPEIGYGSLLSPLERVKVKFVLRHASMVLPVSKSTAKEMLRVANPKKFEIVYNGVNVEMFKPLSEKENLVITVANITEATIKKKGLDIFVKTAAYLPETQFVLIGKYDDSIQHLRKITGSNVVFAGYLPNEALLTYYRRAKVYCQLSAHESFGVALAEAMACGCVPVVTKRYALPEVVGDTGFYVPYNNPKATAEAIQKALKSNKGEKARERIQRKFSLKTREEKLVKQITNLFQN